MGFAFNPFTGNFDQKGSGGGGGGSAFFSGEVATYADLPLDGSAALDSRWLVRSNSGTWPFSSYKQAGVYVRKAIVGASRDNDYQLTDTSFFDVMSDSAFLLYDDGDATKNLKFQLSGISASTTVTLTAPDASGRIQVEGQPIGNTTPAAGTFTTLAANNGTLTASAPAGTFSQTWNASGTTFTGLSLAITNTASASASAYLSFALDGTQAFSIRRGETTASATVITCGGAGGLTWTARTRTGGGVGVNFSGVVGVGSSLQFGTGTSTTSGDITISREAANILAQSNGLNAQEFRIYNTFTSATNHERGFLKWSSNVFQIGTEKGSGGGTARALALQTDGTTRMTVGTDGFVGIGVTAERPLHIQGTAAVGRIDRVGVFGPAWMMTRIDASVLQSSWLFGPATGFASVTNDDFAIIDYGTATTGTGGTARLTISKTNGQLTVNGNLNLSTKDLVTDTTTGTKIGTGTTQKIGFFNATPVVQQAAVANATDAASTQDRLNDLLARLRTLGLIAT